MIIELLNENKKIAYPTAFLVRQTIKCPIVFLPYSGNKPITIKYVSFDDKIIPLVSSLILCIPKPLTITPVLRDYTLNEN
jgi:hypothetical protein